MDEKLTRRNHEHYIDPTPYEALKNIDAEKERVSKLVRTIFYICDLAGFRVSERIVLVNKKSGRVWK